MPTTQSERGSEPTFLGIPERWLDDPTWKCSNGHISKRFLKSEALGGDVCLACQEPVRLCDPDEREPSGLASAVRRWPS